MVQPTSISAGWLIDGTAGPIRETVRITLRSGLIESMSQQAGDGYSKRGPRTDHHIDFGECTLLPCFIDSHVHLCLSGTVDTNVRSHQLVAGFDEVQAVIRQHLIQHFACGVLAVRDGGDHRGHALRYKLQNQKSGNLPIELKAAGHAWHQSERYGKLIGLAPHPGETLADAIRGSQQECDHVKVVNSGLNSLSQFGQETPPQFSLGEMQAAVQAARRQGLQTMVHANGKLPVNIAVAAGCHSIEHGFFMGRENLKQMAGEGITWVPTAVTMKAYADHMQQNGRRADVARKNLDHQLEQLRRARDIQVPVALGTDAGSPGVHHGAAVADEIGLLLEAGFSIQEAIRCATWNGAKLLGLKETGRLVEAMPATFIAVKGDPSNLPGSLTKIKALYFKGREVDIPKI